jgi:G protein-coupled receptor 158
MDRYTALPATSAVNGTCNTQKDDVGNYYWQETDTATGDVYCGGTNYSQLALDGSNMDPFVPYAYDATYAVAHALHIMFYENNQTSVDGPTLFGTLINNVSFRGVTGWVSFQKAQTGDAERYGEGDRVTGVTYAIYNFQPSLYLADITGSAGLKTVGLWTSEGGVQMCSQKVFAAFGACSVVYNTVDNNPPSDSDPDIIYSVPSSTQRYFLYALAAAVAFIVVVFAAVTLVFRAYLRIRSSRIPMLLSVLLGTLMAAARTALGALEPSVEACAARLWLSHLAFWLVFGTLTVKTWRVRSVLKASLKRLKVTAKHMSHIVFAFASAVSVYLVVATVVGQPRTALVIFSETSNQATKELVCTMKYTQFEAALFAAELVLVCFGMRLCWVTRTVPDALNETRYVFAAVIFIILVSVIVLPLYIFLKTVRYTDKSTMLSVAFAVASLVAVLLMFMPILFAHKKRTELQRNLESVRGMISAPAPASGSDTTDGMIRRGSSSLILNAMGRMILNATGLNGMPSGSVSAEEMEQGTSLYCRARRCVVLLAQFVSFCTSCNPLPSATVVCSFV